MSSLDLSTACPCRTLGAPSEKIVIDSRPIENTAIGRNLAPEEQELVLSLVHVVSSLQGLDCKSWSLEQDFNDEALVNVLFAFEPNTCVTYTHFEMIRCVNRLRVRQVWVQPETDQLYIGVALQRAGTQVLTVAAVVHISSISTTDPAVARGGGSSGGVGSNKRSRT